MARNPQPKGTCFFCQKQYAKGGLRRHLASCKARAAANTAARGKSQKLYHLRASAAYGAPFWLDLEVRGSARLRDIDHYLRHIWLECCGHMSNFSPERWGAEMAASTTVGTAFARVDKLVHLYDFGTTSETIIERVAVREGAPLSKYPIYLMARNERPDAPCMVCGESAEFVCIECIYEDDTSGFLCAKHMPDHPHDDYGEPQELLNSPRVGMCGELVGDQPPY
jgi:hypothetical protein